MENNNQALPTFLAEVKPTQLLWALQDKKSEDWVVLDSINYEETEVMPLWSDQALAAVHCTEEWEEYVPAAITLADWFEFWVDDLIADGVVIGINWLGEDNDLEIDLSEFTQSLAEIEAL
ncbi:DUF2750 domain-containing protein [Psychromonas antarctica]|uniref:DUF2750 domain-containing protein n=1 Tax=Psychromonas antarctica TaxID=67573 RepID=UPI001EE97280|nr:DUF2750 domain-containing protein [Psychromonas antarctica]MCG6200346.1 DUF2750 domain-containing protein [Psychromonas antarctica]